MEIQSQLPLIPEISYDFIDKLKRDMRYAANILPNCERTLDGEDFIPNLNRNTKAEKARIEKIQSQYNIVRLILANLKNLYSDLDLSAENLTIDKDILRLMQMFVNMQSNEINFEHTDVVVGLLGALSDYESFSREIKGDQFREYKILEKLFPIYQILQKNREEIKVLIQKYQSLLTPKQFTYPQNLKKFRTQECLTGIQVLIDCAVNAYKNTELTKESHSQLRQLLLAPLASLSKSLTNTHTMLSAKFAVVDNAFRLESLNVSLTQLEKIFERISSSNYSTEVCLLTELIQQPIGVQYSLISFIRSQAFEGLNTPDVKKIQKIKELDAKLVYLRSKLFNKKLSSFELEDWLNLELALVDYDNTIKARINSQRLDTLKNQKPTS